MRKILSLVVLALVLVACEETPGESSTSAELNIGNASSVTLAAGNNNNLQWQFSNIDRAVSYMTPNASGSTITGLNTVANGGTSDPGVANYASMWVVNVSTSVDIVIASNSSSSTNVNRIKTPGATAYTLTPGRSVQLYYDAPNQGMWVLLAEPTTSIAGLATTGYVDSAVSGLASTSYVDTAIATAIADYATTSYVDEALGELPADDYSGLVVVPSAGSSHAGLGLDVARQPSTTRPTRVTASGSMTLTSTVLGAQTASVALKSDSSATPTVTILTVPAGLSGVAATVTFPWTLTYDVPTGDYYILSSAHSANASVALTAINETAE